MKHPFAALAALALAASAAMPETGAPPSGTDCFHADPVN